MFFACERKFLLISPCWFSPKHPPRLVLLKYPGGFQKLAILKQEFQLAEVVPNSQIRPSSPNSVSEDVPLWEWCCLTCSLGVQELHKWVMWLFKIRVLSHFSSAFSRNIRMTSREMFPLHLLPPNPLCSFSSLFIWVAGTFPSKSRSSNPWHRIPRFEGENTFCLTWLSSFKYPTYTLTPRSKLAYLWGFYTEWMRKLFTVSKQGKELTQLLLWRL